ncbi:MAG: Major facilitator superfamily [Candidatus Levybacteria bacterium GW2011_GWA1_37_16]|nr:MAG: Major facilitator superfamily [Candidatus Levybacteria bacterium GW2011_GWA1_37_16]
MNKIDVKSERFAALRYRDFRLLWIGLLISNIGSQMQFAAINWHIFILTHSAVSLGLIGLSRFIPIAFFSLIGGAVADARNRKTILFITQIVLMSVSVFLAFATLLNIATPLIIYIITAISSIAIAFDSPPRQAIIPSLVHKDHLTNAMSLNSIMWRTAMIVGPTFAGIIIGQFGVAFVYFINAVSFIGVIVALVLMKTSGEVEGEPSKISFKAILEGLSFVKSKPIIWSTMILDFFSTFFASATSLLPIFAVNVLNVGSKGYGLLYAAESIGAVLSGYILAHLGVIKNQGKTLLIAVFIYGLATVVFGLSKMFIISFFALFFVGVGDSVSTIIRNTIRQLTTPDYIRGRMTSVNMIFFMGGPQLGEFEAGMLAAMIGAPLSVVVGGIATIAVVGVVALKIPVLRRYTGEK